METATEHKLQSLIRMYREGYRNPIIDQSIDKLVALEIAHFRKELERLKARLTAFEHKYDMDSTAFYEKFQAGALGDELPFVEWSVFCDLHLATQKHLNELKLPAV